MAGVSDEVSAICRVRNRRLFIEDRRRFDEAVSRLDDRWDYEIAVRRLYANRSQQQNRYYWGVVVEMLSEYTGFTPDEMHEWLKMKFIPKKLAVCDGNGEVDGEFVVGGSTRKMTPTQFEDYMRTIREWAAEKLDVVIPDPDGAVLPVASAGGHGWGI
jgi:hypothetical protein